ncbi:MAG: hypothetical protein WBA37_09535, partial [Xanthobacteraceae bacterium]
MPGRAALPAAGAPRGAVVPGWVMVRLNGCAAFGAVVVVDGAEKVREPREPKLPPRPARASAAEIAMTINGNANATARASV